MTSSRRSAKSKRPTTRASEPIQDAQVYRDMLNEAGSHGATEIEQGDRPAKKRRVGGRLVGNEEPERSELSSIKDQSELDEEPPNIQARAPQVVYDDSQDSEESEADWEDVDIKKEESSSAIGDEGGDLTIELGQDGTSSSATPKRARLAPVADQKARIEAHKLHLMSLLSHVHLRNHWCNTPEAQKALKPFLSKQTLSLLEDQDDQPQFQRSHRLQAGLTQASQDFRNSFRVLGRGLSRCYWVPDAKAPTASAQSGDADLPLEKSDFCKSAVTLEASRDVGAQIFCTLLRAAGAETRLVCSLQVLPLAPAVKNPTSSLNPGHPFDFPPSENNNDDVESDFDDDEHDSKSAANPTIIRRSGLTSRIGRSALPARSSPKPSPRPSKRPGGMVRESSFPVFWVEVFDAAYQKWIPVDPLVTKTIAKPSKFEPPASDAGNTMSYVIAFQEDGSAVDVTKRYAKAYNAKTRRSRVESTKAGDKWWKRVMRMYRRGYRLDRDEVEESQLLAKEAAEPMPKNVADFKDHPYFVLERHLRRSEVIQPRREAGKVSVGNKILEPIFRRQDVHHVKSADGWYRLGRDIKTGEQPLKWHQARRQKDPLFDEDASESEEQAGKPMFAAFQTCPYQAPPVVNGRVPRNIYGNIDVYVPSMVPAGGAHVANPDAARTARLLGIDYADAVSGFEFKGRAGTAVVNGAVVAAEYKEAVWEVIRGFEYEREEALLSKRTDVALRMWKRLLTGLRVQERIEGYDIEGEKGARGQAETQGVATAAEDDNKPSRGFMAEVGNEEPSEEPMAEADSKELSGGFTAEVDNEEPSVGFMAEADDEDGHSLTGDMGSEEGGFLPADDDSANEDLIEDDDDDDDGGFLPEDIELE